MYIIENILNVSRSDCKSISTVIYPLYLLIIGVLSTFITCPRLLFMPISYCICNIFQLLSDFIDIITTVIFVLVYNTYQIHTS